MANPEHLKILKEGTRAWNIWRDAEYYVTADLEDANLAGISLEEANLEGAGLDGAYLARANLSRANIEGASLRDADLEGANLTEAKFEGANLQEANLADADLEGANLAGTNLKKANLAGANLARADIEGANLTGADLYECILSDLDLSEAKGLNDCRHVGPSCVDHRTLARSKNVPIGFWRGCGLPDWQIEVAKLSQPALTQEDVTDVGYEVIRLRGDQPIQLFSPFISYSSKDEEFARQLYDNLQNNGVRCWFAPEDMKIGDRMRRRIDEVIHIHDKLLLVLSGNSVRSSWVEKEVETAFEKERVTGKTVLFPIKLDNAVDKIKTGWAADIRRTRHIGDFTRWDNTLAFQASFSRVLRDLRAVP